MPNEMPHRDSFAIVISAPGLDQATRAQAEQSLQLVNVKVNHESEVVSEPRAQDARLNLLAGMRVFFHQGGAPSKWSQEFPSAGRVVALGCYFSLNPLRTGDPPPNVPMELWQVTRAIFRDRELTHTVHYRDVKRIEGRLQPLTKDIMGRPPRSGENYVVVSPNQPGHAQLRKLWAECHRS